MLDVIKKRRSIRDYNDQEISKSDLVTLCEAGLMAPSARLWPLPALAPHTPPAKP